MLIIQKIDAAIDVGINRKVKPAIEELVNKNYSLEMKTKKLEREVADLSSSTSVVAVKQLTKERDLLHLNL
jgi:hypothetical protein